MLKSHRVIWMCNLLYLLYLMLSDLSTTAIYFHKGLCYKFNSFVRQWSKSLIKLSHRWFRYIWGEQVTGWLRRLLWVDLRCVKLFGCWCGVACLRVLEICWGYLRLLTGLLEGGLLSYCGLGEGVSLGGGTWYVAGIFEALLHVSMWVMVIIGLKFKLNEWI